MPPRAADVLYGCPLYSVIHPLVVDVSYVLFQSACMIPKQNTRNIYHKQMNNGVHIPPVFCGEEGFRGAGAVPVDLCGGAGDGVAEGGAGDGAVAPRRLHLHLQGDHP